MALKGVERAFGRVHPVERMSFRMTGPAAPRLLFLLLAHDRPTELAELACTLVAAASDARCLIHFDANASDAAYAALQAAIADEPRVSTTARRRACSWGGFSLVAAPLDAMEEAAGWSDFTPDRVILVSGACLPCRPIRQLERYFAENPEKEFIEAEDSSWMASGWRDERWMYRFWFDHNKHYYLEHAFFRLQRLLGLRRRPPEGLTPRFGSQWWALSWDTCQKIRAHIRAHPDRFAFFRQVWIPDEMVFQTYVHALVPQDRIAGFALTHFHFSNHGKPLVFHDDHIDYVGTLQRFFVRKISPRATALRRHLLDRAAAPDDPADDLRMIGRPQGPDYTLKTAAQTNFPRPGQIFYADQTTGCTGSVLTRQDGPYVVVFGPSEVTGAVADGLPPGAFTVLGEVFRHDRVDLGPEGPEIGGLRETDTALRNAHPALFLTRVRAQCPKVPVIRWSPFHAPDLFDAVLWDRNACLVLCLPDTGLPETDRNELARHSAEGLAFDPAALPSALPDTVFPGLPAGLVARARAARCGTAYAHALGEDRWSDWLGDAMFWSGEHLPRGLRGNQLVISWAPGQGSAGLAAVRRFDRSLAANRFQDTRWFAALAGQTRRVLAAGGRVPDGPAVRPRRVV